MFDYDMRFEDLLDVATSWDKSAMYNSTKEAIEGLLGFYGLDTKIVDIVLDDVVFVDYVSRSRDEIPKYLDVLKLYRLLKVCQGCKLTIQGTITESNASNIKGTLIETTIDSKDFIKALANFVEAFLCYHSHSSIEEWETIEQISLSSKKSRNAILGAKAKTLIEDLETHIWSLYKENWSKTKLYSFIYDLIRLHNRTGKKIIQEDGYLGIVGRDKCMAVANWIRAYEKWKTKEESRGHYIF